MPTKQTKYDPDLLNAALKGYQSQKTQIEERITDIRQRLGNGAPSLTAAAGAAMALERPQPKKRHRISLEGRKRIAEAQRARWAKAKKG